MVCFDGWNLERVSSECSIRVFAYYLLIKTAPNLKINQHVAEFFPISSKLFAATATGHAHSFTGLDAVDEPDAAAGARLQQLSAEPSVHESVSNCRVAR